MSEWNGPWKCEECGDTFTPEFGRERIHDGLCHYGPGPSGVCFGELVPYERRAADERVRELVGALEDMVLQFAYKNNRGQITTGGLSALENAFAKLGWDDPHDVPGMLCDEPGCTQFICAGIPTPTGYRMVCSEHAAILRKHGKE